MRYFQPRFLLLGLMIILGLCFTFLVPPFQKPDENRHYYQAVALSRGVLSCRLNSSGKPYLPIPASFYTFPKQLKYDEIAHTPDFKFFPSQLGLYRYGQSEVVEASDWCSWSFVGYAFPSLGILIGSLTHSHLIEFYLARILPFMVFVICILLSLKKTIPKYHGWIFFYALLPMTLHQATSISYDSLQLALIPLLFAYVTRFLDSPHQSLDRRTYAIFMLILLVFVISKPLSVIFLLLIFTIPKINWRSAILLLVCSFLITLPYLRPLHYADLGGGVNPSQQLGVVVRDPLYFAEVLTRTISQDSLEIIKGIVGNFGWLDYELPIIVYLLYVTLFGYLIGRSSSSVKNISLMHLIILSSVIIGYYLSTYGALYLSWTNVGEIVIKGVQGRYFLVIVPFLGLVISELIGKIRSSHKAKVLVIIAGGIGLLAIVTASIYWRYWDYSKYGITLPALPSSALPPAILGNSTYPLKIEGSAKGVGFYFHLVNNPSSDMVYRYQIKSSDCQTTTQVGYFSVPSPDRNLTFVVSTKPFALGHDGACLAIESISGDSILDLSIYPGVDGTLIHPLYLVPSLIKSSL